MNYVEKMKTQRNGRIDLIRILLCTAVFLYHLDLLKGGYLAVCAFFVLSGYFTVNSLNRRKDESLLRYYADRFRKIYVPLFMTVCLSVLAVSFLPSINWITLKPETTSVLLGFNNFYQIAARQDYFARTSSSPLLHLWYLSILLQYELICPIFHRIAKKVFGKRSDRILCGMTLVLGILSILVFGKRVGNGEIMSAYYGTFSRMNALLLGSSLAYFHNFHRPVIFGENKTEEYLYLSEVLILCGVFLWIGPEGMVPGLLAVIVLSMRLIEHSLCFKETRIGIFSLSEYTYAFYLVHYPVIFLFSRTTVSYPARILSIVVLSLCLSFLLKKATDLRRIRERRPFSILLCVFLMSMSLFGFIRYLKTEDHTEEMKELEERLSENERLIEEKNRDYQNILEKERQEWQKLYEDSANKEETVKEILRQMPIVGIGDSILLDAIPDLYELFPNGWFDAKISRNLYTGEEILKDLIEEGKLSDTVILCLATNGDYIESRNAKLMEILGDREVFWIDAVGADDPEFNRRFASFAQNYDNLHIIPWEQYSKGHPEWFYSDGIHVVGRGVRAFAELIYDSVYEVSLKNFEKETQEALEQIQEQEREHIAFYGNKALINIYSDLSQIPKASFHVKEDYDFETLDTELQERIASDDLEYQVVFLFDQQAGLEQEDHQKIVKILEGHRILICDLYGDLSKGIEGARIIDFSADLKEHEEYLSPDRIHLSEIGNQALVKKILEALRAE